MLTNFHTHSMFCDGDNTPEEIVSAALDFGFSAIGFSFVFLPCGNKKCALWTHFFFLPIVLSSICTVIKTCHTGNFFGEFGC